MRYRRTSLAEDLMMAPWWVSVVLCIIGNIVIWFVIPGYLEANRPGGITANMLTGGYEGAKPIVSKFFNLAMALVFVFSLFNSYFVKKRRRF